MKTLLTWTIVGALVLVASTAAAEEDEGRPSFSQITSEVEDFGDIVITVGSKSLVVSWQGIEVGPNISAWLRDKVDGLDGSDPDGNITEEEADSAEFLLEEYVQREFDVYAHEGSGSRALLIDQSSAKEAAVNSLAAHGVTGPVNSTEGIDLSFVATVAFPTRSADVHTVKLDMGKYYFRETNASKVNATIGDSSITVRGAEGWSIDEASIQPDCAREQFDAESGAMVFTSEDVNCFTERSGVILLFSITGHDDEPFNVPGFEGPLLVSALLGTGLLLRRRK